MRKLKNIIYLVIVVITLSAFKRDNTITIFMIGDSTMANKPIKNGNLERGWGMALQCYFDEGIIVDNHAVNGRSSKSFIDEGRWKVVVDKIKPGDYVFIQFGHNDEKPKADRHTDPGSNGTLILGCPIRKRRRIRLSASFRRTIYRVLRCWEESLLSRRTSGSL